eukprot:COSAG03_NODE_1698_length_3631_cov_8.163080_4_plen_61_part_00
MWCKMSCLELGTRVPLIFKAPWLTDQGGTTGKPSHALAELVSTEQICARQLNRSLDSGGF